jgi:hypothetical protein
MTADGTPTHPSYFLLHRATVSIAQLETSAKFAAEDCQIRF